MKSATLPLVEKNVGQEDSLVLRLHKGVIEYIWLWFLPNLLGMVAFFFTAVLARMLVSESLMNEHEMIGLSIVALAGLISLALVHARVRFSCSTRVIEIEREMDEILSTEEGQEAERKLSVCLSQAFSGIGSFPPFVMW